MQKHFLLFLSALFLLVELPAQTIQWADSVEAYSTFLLYEKYPGQYEPKEILGPPSTRVGKGSTPCAWATKEPSREELEFIRVSFAKPMQVQQIAVHEAYNAGAISAIYLYDTVGTEYKVYTNATPAPAGEFGRLFHHFMDLTPYKVKSLKLELATGKVAGHNIIESIAISDGAEEIKIEVNYAPETANISGKQMLNPGINTSLNELSPQISADGRKLILTRERKDPAIQDIWVSEKDSTGEFGAAVKLGKPLNNDQNNSSAGISPDGQTMLLINKYLPDGSVTKGVSLTHWTGTEWGFPEALDIKNYYNDNKYGEYCLAPDRKTLIMTVQRKESEGNKDLFYSHLQEDGSWSEPKSMGPLLNTAASEISPFLAGDGRTLYFASSGHPGFGSTDMFLSRRIGEGWEDWTKPLNLGPVLNTPAFDAYYTLPASGEFAYFTSYKNKDADSDIYRIKLPKVLRPDAAILVRGRVLHARTGEPLGSDITYESLSRQEKLGLATSNPVTGEFRLVLPKGEIYGFLAESEGFLSISRSLDLTQLEEYGEVTLDLELVPLEKGEVIPLNNVFFDYNKSSLQAAAGPELDRLVQIMNKKPGLVVEIAGHTDSRGGDAYNLDLSQRRAASVVDYLKEKGIATDRLKPKGYGETEPVDTNETDEGRAKNRRVELRILSI